MNTSLSLKKFVKFICEKLQRPCEQAMWEVDFSSIICSLCWYVYLTEMNEFSKYNWHWMLIMLLHSCLVRSKRDFKNTTALSFLPTTAQTYFWNDKCNKTDQNDWKNTRCISYNSGYQVGQLCLFWGVERNVFWNSSINKCRIWIVMDISIMCINLNPLHPYGNSVRGNELPWSQRRDDANMTCSYRRLLVHFLEFSSYTCRVFLGMI